MVKEGGREKSSVVFKDGRKVSLRRESWVWILAPYTGWTLHFLTMICCWNCIVCLKRPKINKKEARVGPFLKNNSFMSAWMYCKNVSVGTASAKTWTSQSRGWHDYHCSSAALFIFIFITLLDNSSKDTLRLVWITHLSSTILQLCNFNLQDFA